MGDKIGDRNEPSDSGYWHAESPYPGVVASVVGYASTGRAPWIHRGLPSPYLTFVVTFDEPVITAWSADEVSLADAGRFDVVTAGLHLAPAYIRQPPSQSGIQLALQPGAARTVLGVPASELCHASYEGRDVVGPDVGRLRDRLIETQDWGARFAVVEEFLHRRTAGADSRPAMRPEVAAAWAWLGQRHGTGRISAVAQHVLLSERQLHALFTAEFGIGPKRFNRLLRFDRARRLIAGRVDHGREVDLAGIAARCGYADQSHLSRDFVSLTGTSPGRWVAEELDGIDAGSDR